MVFYEKGIINHVDYGHLVVLRRMRKGKNHQ